MHKNTAYRQLENSQERKKTKSTDLNGKKLQLPNFKVKNIWP